MSIESAEVTEPLSPNSPLVSDGVDGVRTTRLLNRAIKQRWPITDEQRQAIIERQIAIASRKNGKAREQSIAAKTVAAFDQINMAEEKASEPLPTQQHLHLHQHQPTVDLDKLTDEQLDKLEQILLAASSTTTTDRTNTDTAG